MIQVGKKIAIDFNLNVCRNGNVEEVDFKDLLTRKTIVSVYMKNNTSSCDRQNTSLAAQADKFDEMGFNVVAISKDSCRSHKNYAEKMGIKYTLASDPDYNFAAATDSIVDKKMYGKNFRAPSRSAFVLNTDGTVLGIIKKVNSEEHAEELFRLIESKSL